MPNRLAVRDQSVDRAPVATSDGTYSETQLLNERMLYRVTEAAALLAISRSNVYGLMNAGKLPSVRIGSRRLIRRAALESFVDELAEGPLTE